MLVGKAIESVLLVQSAIGIMQSDIQRRNGKSNRKIRDRFGQLHRRGQFLSKLLCNRLDLTGQVQGMLIRLEILCGSSNSLGKYDDGAQGHLRR